MSEIEILDQFDESTETELDTPPKTVTQAVSFGLDGVLEVIELRGELRRSVRLSPESAFKLYELLEKRFKETELQ